MNYYQHHIGDFIRDTARLSDAQCMAYLRMIWVYYETEEPLESDVDALAFKIGANASDVKQILKHFFFEHDGRWHNSRCDREILAFRDKSKKAKQSANARWDNAKAMRTHSDRNADERVFDANQEPITNNQEPIKKKHSGYTPEFEKAWAAYPKRPGANKAESFKAWSARIKEGVEPALIIAGVARYAEYCKKLGTAPNYIKQAVTFFGPGRHYESDWTVSISAAAPARQSAMNAIGVDDETPEGFSDGFQ